MMGKTKKTNAQLGQTKRWTEKSPEEILEIAAVFERQANCLVHDNTRYPTSILLAISRAHHPLSQVKQLIFLNLFGLPANFKNKHEYMPDGQAYGQTSFGRSVQQAVNLH